MARAGTHSGSATKLHPGFSRLAVLGVLLVLAGIVGPVHTAAALNIAVGIVVIRLPHAAAAAPTMFAALLFLTAGFFRLVGGLVVRGPQLGWTLLGAFDLLLGILVLGSWPSSGQYVIGAFFSLALLFDGLGLVATGYGGRRIVGLVSEQEQPGPARPE
ncbi:hypothetical protein FB563_7429 [Streptomyces puniciscabiei]|uniref:Uncharacterized protein n=1 Tax=Streptomyces puniciscabiei TaxID=164348 RepID=A0A542T065_9ACTN|nr:hypothetical protein [Streptomyces puniciscabiei]TQK80250.1 hypothetical protein FB563_7429 [Streptomyces puniciscabiei]